MKRLGIIAQMINSGIGTQSHEFAKHLKPDKVLITDLSILHTAAGKSITNYPGRFDNFNTRTTNGLPDSADMDWLLEDIDVLFFIETALNWELLHLAKERGVHTIGQMNYELMDKLHPQYGGYPVPDEIWMPSSWHYPEMEAKAKEWGCIIKQVDVPINRELLPFAPKRRAANFLHVAGHPTYEDRNGTEIVLAAIPLVKNQNIRFTIRTQQKLELPDDPRVRLQTAEARNYYEMFRNTDVLLLPRRYGGLSLQRNEALSVGMPTVMPDISPQTGELPEAWLVPAKYQKTITTRPEIDIFEVSPQELADKIDYIAKLSEFTFTNWSMRADLIAHTLDWKVQEPIYRALLEAEEPPEPTMPEEYFDEWGKGKRSDE